mmetsp:Transcript_53538/g.164664  ORF Transcript_53538/g.164664 Transcript_53538/m.164664 type:complete len:203 (+) Transcript_53538:152-760(+)
MLLSLPLRLRLLLSPQWLLSRLLVGLLSRPFRVPSLVPFLLIAVVLSRRPPRCVPALPRGLDDGGRQRPVVAVLEVAVVKHGLEQALLPLLLLRRRASSRVDCGVGANNRSEDVLRRRRISRTRAVASVLLGGRFRRAGTPAGGALRIRSRRGRRFLAAGGEGRVTGVVLPGLDGGAEQRLHLRAVRHHLFVHPHELRGLLL